MFAAQANAATSIIPMPGSPSGVTPMNTVASAMSAKSLQLLMLVNPVTDSATPGSITMPPTVNITISHGPHTVAILLTAPKPQAATSTDRPPKMTTRATNPMCVG